MSKVSERVTAYWQDSANVVLGLWLLVSPWILGFATNAEATHTAWGVGAIMVAGCLLLMWSYEKWGEWAVAAVAAWFMASPWVMFYQGETLAMWNALLVGTVIVVLSLWSAFAEHGTGGAAAAG